jgi:secreted trypsin-like serine protease
MTPFSRNTLGNLERYRLLYYDCRVRRFVGVVAAVVAALAFASSGQAITGGQRDGNAHPSVGAMMAFWDPSTPNTLQELCTGTLIAPRLFLTAAHCTDFLLHDLGITDVWVTFSPDSSQGPYVHGVMRQSALFPGPSSDPHDIAVIVLDEAVSEPLATLPSIGQLDRMKDAKTLNQSTLFTAVGYGDGRRLHSPGSGSHTFFFDGFRWVASSFFNSLSPSWLRLTQNSSVGAGGTCAGDSGGPNFLGTSNVIAAITIGGDNTCVSTNVDYRMDTAEAQGFLRGFGWRP